MRQKLRILTINTWLLRLPFGLSLAPKVDERAARLPDSIAATGADIVLCQEVWDPKMRRRLRRELASRGYAYEASAAPALTARMPGALAGLLPLSLGSIFAGLPNAEVITALSGGALASVVSGSLLVEGMRKAMGNGLQIFSRFPLESKVDVMPFSTYTRPDELFIAKGAIRARAQVPSLGWVDLYNSHLGAVSYNQKAGAYDAGQCERRGRQAMELAAWIERTRTSENAVLGVDLNASAVESGRPTNEHGLFSSRSGNLDFVDTFEVAGETGCPGHTDVAANPYKQGGYFSGSPDARIDYIFASRSRKLRPVRSHVTFKEALPGPGAPERLSDHYGVITEFEIG